MTGDMKMETHPWRFNSSQQALAIVVDHVFHEDLKSQSMMFIKCMT
jgi:hypothetical protein